MHEGSPTAEYVVFQAFDAAWANTCDHFAGEDVAAEDARLKVTYALLIVTRPRSARMPIS